jgi:hypothetical protein
LGEYEGPPQVGFIAAARAGLWYKESAENRCATGRHHRSKHSFRLGFLFLAQASCIGSKSRAHTDQRRTTEKSRIVEKDF